MSKFIFSLNLNNDNDNDNGKITTFINHYSYMIARKNPELLAQFNEIHCDGIVLCLFLKLIGIHKTRTSFDMTSIAPEIFNNAADNSESVYFVGGEPGVVESAVSSFTSKYPTLKVEGLRHGYFSSSTEREIVLLDIVHKNPDYVIASMGSPFQEQFLVDLRAAGWKGRGYTSGGFFHQTAKAGLKYYPAWIDKLNLRWAYRIYDEPKLFKRYTTSFIRFIFLFSYDVFISKLGQK
ncbi:MULTISPECIES: WecB/TagA/CpsF family glycosyltransferase [Pseudomonas]|uniref:UDP-Gal:alpha-D-GlcNAc-diphosphoundecaprenol beta-1,4-galactosyltransferase n=1 Tax=Pseudomonas fluorescens TaxID=294 RepID=A0A5E6PP01_PSEFL|nr:MULTISPECIES: WecB/TagA/CpsF family glycosyltransferase [Pseudomonas]VVM43192.1 UDP-Gal:alpha-D-GlcNAc-diphosphoundecaprenol beta-1,4-galactosyltransferase [Pseudomonas fluorescens]